jgi:hypothetical protein
MQLAIAAGQFADQPIHRRRRIRHLAEKPHLAAAPASSDCHRMLHPRYLKNDKGFAILPHAPPSVHEARLGSARLSNLRFSFARKGGPPQPRDITAGYTGPIAAADLHVTPDGRFLYGSERRTSSLAGFRIDPAQGTLSRIGSWPTEATPRGFAVDPRGRFLLSVGLDSNRMTVYAIHQDTGTLDPLNQYAMGKMPNWIEFVDLQ